MDLKNKICIVTGGTKGIGLATVKKMVELGAKVYVGARNIENIVIENVVFKKLDVSDNKSCEDFFNFVLENEKNVDVLVANAGVMQDALTVKMTDEMFDNVIKINLKGVFNIVRLVGPYMEKNGHGSIITISSIASNGEIGKANYSASKAGVIAMTKTWAKEFARKGANVRVNALSPGCIKTDMLAQIPEKIYNELASSTMLKRLGEPEEIANAICFLASDDASYITGTVLNVDGGMRI